MKLIKAYVRGFMVSRVVEALKAANAPRLTVVDVKSLGDEIPHEELKIPEELGATYKLSAELGSTYTTMVKIELICSDKQVKQLADAILGAARTGYKGDGLIAISPVEEAISIRTRKEAIEG